ncbi:MAG: FHA domain-containing protein, partial [Chloroflexota bacterium]
MNSPHTSNAVLILKQTGQTFSLAQELLTIGRKSGNSIVLADDLKVSRHHTTISRRGKEFFIEDMGSANGTYVNERRLEAPQPLKNGDVIQVGDTVFIVSLPLAETRPRRTPLAPARAETSTGPAGFEADTSIIHRTRYVSPDNPYVGPRTFTQQEKDRFFGREREAQELLSLVIAERLVLFYAQSGAGKSSLINARLVPQLRQADFPVLPIGRVSGELPQSLTTVTNLYTFNLLLSMDESDGPPERFAHMPLSDFLVRLTSVDGQHYYYDEHARPELEIEEEGYAASPYVLIIDQFEEILTTHPERWEDREDFFRQLGQAMANDPYLWVVLALREDYVAPLDPYVHLLPG